MPSEDATYWRGDSPGGVFQTTHWSVVLRVSDGQSGEAQQALEQLCQTYWYPLYAFARRKGYTHEQSQDFTQAFCAKLLEKNQIALADPERGRFRTFLLRSFENFLRSEHRDAIAKKRGGGRQLLSWDADLAAERYSSDCADGVSPTVLFERQWATVLLQSVVDLLRKEFSQSGKAELFDHLEPHLWGDDASTGYPQIAEALKMTTVSVRVTLHRLRRRFHDLLRAQIAHTVENVEEVEDELRYLRRLWAS
jgi:RNA polymerase sigma-70 factor (ECF subfamily)